MIILALSLFAQATAIPAPYRGQWTTDISACGGEDTEGVLIEARTISFYEAAGAVRSVSQGVKGMTAKVEFTGEGKTWQEGVRLRPLAGNRLEVTALGQTLRFTRCPGAK